MGIVLNSASDRGLYPYVAYPSRHRDGDLSRDDEAGLPRRRASSDAATLNSRGAQEMYQPRLSVVSHQTPVAVLGCGYWGMNYVRVFSGSPGARVLAVCDKRPIDFRRSERRFRGVILTTGRRARLAVDGVDAVVICTQANTHFAIAKAASGRQARPGGEAPHDEHAATPTS